jgi:hydrogenase maturation protein HypF
LAGIADAFLLHDRPIHTRTDDSVVRAVPPPAARTVILRRSRGYVPASLPLPGPGAPQALLACGAQLKNTFCLAKNRRAWVSHHVGDLENYETLRSFSEGIDHFRRLFAVDPEVVVHDLHPEYLSTKYALDHFDVVMGVQHHHAHLASCLAEHGETGPAIGAIFDGSGCGTDGTVWGGELLVGDLREFERAGHLWRVRLPGGDRAVEEPWRMACAWLAEVCGGPSPIPGALRASVGAPEWEAVARLIGRGLQAPWTSSVGRLFDAVAALCGLRARVSYEGQAAAELEAVADRSERGEYTLALTDDLRLDARPLIAAVHADVEAGLSIPVVSCRFHRGLAAITAEACRRTAEARGLDLVVLSGGVFQNRLLLELTSERVQAHRLRVLVPERLPPNDGGISYGQAAVAAARLQA